MAKVINENSFVVVDEAETEADAPKRARRRSAKVQENATVGEKVKSAQTQVYVTFTNLTDRSIPFGGFNIEPKGTLRLHKAMGNALMKSDMFKQYKRLVWLKAE